MGINDYVIVESYSDAGVLEVQEGCHVHIDSRRPSVRELQDAIHKLRALNNSIKQLSAAFAPGTSGTQESVPMALAMLRSSRENLIREFRKKNVDITVGFK